MFTSVVIRVLPAGGELMQQPKHVPTMPDTQALPQPKGQETQFCYCTRRWKKAAKTSGIEAVSLGGKRCYENIGS